MKSLARGVQRLTEHIFVKGEGCYVTTREGRRLLDFTSGIGVVNTGHCHPRIVDAAKNQCDNLIHGQISIGYTDKILELTEVLLDKKQGTGLEDLDTLFFTVTGAEAVENAVKLARHATGKQGVIAFKGGYHGRTIATMSMTTSNTIYRKGFGPTMPGVFIAPFPYELHGETVEYCLKELELLLRQQADPEDVAALIIEPVLGEGGYVPAPPEFLHGVRDICSRNNILMICDEVQTGFGRTGSYFAYQNSNIKPDILIMAKGLASGFPLAQ